MRKYALFLLLVLSLKSYSQVTLFRDTLISKLPSMSRVLQFADLDKDGFLDAIGTRPVGNLEQLVIYQNDSLAFTLHTPTFPLFDSLLVEVADLNNDSFMDLALIERESGASLNYLHLYMGNGAFGFTSAYKFPLKQLGKVLVADFANNGSKGVLVNASISDSLYCSLFTIDNGTWSPSTTSVPMIFQGQMEALDFDTNGRIDVLIAGLNANGQPIARIYSNNRLVFSDTRAPFPMMRYSSLATGDYDMNGVTDVYLQGEDSLGLQTSFVWDIHKKNILVLPKIPLVKDANCLMADFDHDGKTDLFITGKHSTNTFIAGIYSQRTDAFLPLIETHEWKMVRASAADLNADGNLDLLVTQEDSLQNRVKINTCPRNNGPVFPKFNFNYINVDNLSFFLWDLPEDDFSASNGLTFDLHLGPGIDQPFLHSPETNLRNGKRLVSRQGALFHGNAAYLENLPSTNSLTIGLVSIDNSFATHHYSLTGSDPSGPCSGTFVSSRHTIHHWIDSTFCVQKELTLLSPSGKKMLWYSRVRGILGVKTSIVYHVTENDTLYAAQLEDGFPDYSFALIIRFPKKKLNLGPDLTLCKGAAISLPIDLPSTGLLWKLNGKTFPSFDQKEINKLNGSVQVEVYNPGEKCTVGDTMLIKYHPSFHIQLEASLTPEGTLIEATGAYKYRWSNPAWHVFVNDSTLLTKPPSNAVYEIVGYDKFGCSNSTRIEVSAIKTVFVPDLFSPNGDGNNDVFKIYGENIQHLNFYIVDRNGNKVFEATKIDQYWDGISNGGPMPAGLYFWELSGNFYDGSPLSGHTATKGTLRLVR